MGSIITHLVGLIYLHIRYRDDQKVSNILKRYYNDSYSAAGLVYMLNAFAFTMAMVLIFGLLVGLINAVLSVFE